MVSDLMTLLNLKGMIVHRCLPDRLPWWDRALPFPGVRRSFRRGWSCGGQPLVAMPVMNGSPHHAVLAHGGASGSGLARSFTRHASGDAAHPLDSIISVMPKRIHFCNLQK
jgi:hypothetical protein